MNKPFVKNAADAGQVKNAKDKASYGRDVELDDVRAVLSTVAGRRFYWRLLGHCRVFESIWHPSALIHHNSGKQDVGHFLLAEVMESDPDMFSLMMSENKEVASGIKG